MTIKKTSTLAVAFIIIFFSSCSNCKECQDELKDCTQLKNAIQENLDNCKKESEAQATNYDMINEHLGNVYQNTFDYEKKGIEFQNAGTINKTDAIQKVASMEKLIIDAKSHLDQMVVELSKASGENISLKKTAQLLQIDLEKKKTELVDIKSKINSVVGYTVDVTGMANEDFTKMIRDKVKKELELEYEKYYGEKIKRQEEEKEKAITENNALKTENELLNTQVEKNKETIQEKENSIEEIKAETKKNTADYFFNTAKAFEAKAKDHKDFFGPNQKKIDLLREAEKYYKDASKYGKNCDEHLRKLRTDFPKHFIKIDADRK